MFFVLAMCYGSCSLFLRLFVVPGSCSCSSFLYIILYLFVCMLFLVFVVRVPGLLRCSRSRSCWLLFVRGPGRVLVRVK